LRQGLKGKTRLNIDNYTIKQLLNLSKIIGKDEIKLGYYHSLILKDGKIFDNEKVLPDIEDIIQLAVSDNHALALTIEGEVYSFGNNKYGQLGLGHFHDCTIPQLITNLPDIIGIAVNEKQSLFLTIEGKVYYAGNSSFTPTLIDELENIANISSGNFHSLALDNNGSVYIINEHNKVDLLLESTAIVSVSTGDNHSLLLTKRGKVYAFGATEYGQLGLGIEIIQETNYLTIPTIIPDLDDIVYVLAGRGYSLALTKEGTTFEFGIKGGKKQYRPVQLIIPELT
jgi:alpha-tubulin suppressor-like RCC1 family protein